MSSLAWATLVLILGLAALALAMDRHASHLPHLPHAFAGPRLAWTLRVSGGMALASALLLLATALGWPQAALLWLGLLTPATLCVAAALALMDRLGRRQRRK